MATVLTDQFAACLAERVRGPAPVPDGATPAQAPAATTTPEPEKYRCGGAGLVPARANRALDRGVTPRRCARC
jgi:hypothetical protein